MHKIIIKTRFNSHQLISEKTSTAFICKYPNFHHHWLFHKNYSHFIRS